MMKKWPLSLPAPLVVATALLVWMCGACSRHNVEQPKAPQEAPRYPIIEFHFAGAQTISSDTNSRAFDAEFASPQARALEDQTLDKLSHAPGMWFKDKLPAGATDGSAQLRPLLDDLLKSEWFFEMREAPVSPEYALAIRLDATRASLWEDNLRRLLESWTKLSATNITNGWELEKDRPPNLFRIVRAGHWIVIGWGQDQLPLSDEWAAGRIPEGGASWLGAVIDWPRLARVFPRLAKFDLPVIHLQVTGSHSNLFLAGQFDLSQPLPALEKWQIPTNIIHDPLTSFTAARGFAPWLENQSWARPLLISPEPDQLFVWSLGMMPLQTFIAAPVSNGTNALAQLGGNLSANTNWERHLMSHFKLETTPKRISLADVPFSAPEVQALSEKNGDFLVADIFPNLPRGKFPSPVLYQQLELTNLVYYHWEITALRLKALPQMTQLALLLTRHRQLQAASPAAKWLNYFGPRMGTSVTEVMQSGPRELSFVRQAPAGLTAVELIALANWLEAPNFPGCDLSLPPREFVPQTIHTPVKKMTAPVAPPPAKR